ncbi:CPBP family intramembrane glutamic endopeptidase [Thiospirochaeta perfilievii]
MSIILIILFDYLLLKRAIIIIIKSYKSIYIETFFNKKFIFGLYFVLLTILYLLLKFYFLGFDFKNFSPILIFYIILLASLEECIFRLYPLLVIKKNKLITNKFKLQIMYSLIFIVYHLGFNVPQLIYLLFFSQYMFFILEKTRNILFPIIIHALLNIFDYSMI